MLRDTPGVSRNMGPLSEAEGDRNGAGSARH
jgi:hypothetical protein